MPSNHCNCCGKSIWDEVSVALGIGPVCRVKHKLEAAMDQTESLFANRSEYSVVVNDGLFVAIEDHDNGKSVTNDAKEVIQDLVGAGINVDARIVLYRDTQGVWDRIVTKNGKFVGFESVNTRTFEEARRKLLS